MMQAPVAIPVIVVPVTEQTPSVSELKLTVSPEVALALPTVVVVTPSVAGRRLIKPILCVALLMLMFCNTCGAALKLVLPP